MSEERDIVSYLGSAAETLDLVNSGDADVLAIDVMLPGYLRQAADELQRLRGEVSRLTMTLEAEEIGQLVAVDFIDNEHADEVSRLRGEVERLRGASYRLANAADCYGVAHLDSDDLDEESEELQEATLSVRDLLALNLQGE